jgi:MFS family permease
MTGSGARPEDGQPKGKRFSILRNRQLDSYPDTAPRMVYLGLTVLITVAFYYELDISGSVSTLQLADLHMSFPFYVTILAFGSLIGAFGSLLAGITDRFGRCNIIVAGMFVSGALITWGIPAAASKWVFGIETWGVGLVEGICLVATPALVRDFSPQTGRGTAMGLWTMGPVLGLLTVSVIGSNTIHGTPPLAFWGHEYVICGIVGLVAAGLAFLFLRELSPGIRDQLMVTTKDRALIETKAKGLDIETLLKNPFRQLLKADIIISALAIAVFLLVYFTVVGFGTIYYQSIFGFTLQQANGLGNWSWGFLAVALALIGVTTDFFRVRKPFMLLGGLWAMTMLVLYLLQAGRHSSYYHMAVIVALLAVGLGIAFTPWMASFTENVEARNPALMATGLAIQGWILRVVVFIAFLVIPAVINTVTPLVNFGLNTVGYTAELDFAAAHPDLIAEASSPANAAQLAALVKLAANPVSASHLRAAREHSTALATLRRFPVEAAAVSAHPSLFTAIAANPTSKTLQARAIAALGGGSIGASRLATLNANRKAITGAAAFAVADPGTVAFAAAHAATLAWATSHASLVVRAATYKSELAALAKVPESVLAYAKSHGPEAAAAARRSPGQWKAWYWVCFGGMVMFLLAIPLLKGRWSPKMAKADEEAHEAMVQAELAKLNT